MPKQVVAYESPTRQDEMDEQAPIIYDFPLSLVNKQDSSSRKKGCSKREFKVKPKPVKASPDKAEEQHKY